MGREVPDWMEEVWSEWEREIGRASCRERV